MTLSYEYVMIMYLDTIVTFLVERFCFQGQPSPINVKRMYHQFSGPVGTIERVGSYYEYKCISGHELLRGELKRACLNDGTLAGNPAICKRMHHFDAQVIRFFKTSLNHLIIILLVSCWTNVYFVILIIIET